MEMEVPFDGLLVYTYSGPSYTSFPNQHHFTQILTKLPPPLPLKVSARPHCLLGRQGYGLLGKVIYKYSTTLGRGGLGFYSGFRKF